MKEDKYQAIIESAVEVLQSENYQNMKTAVIAKGAGIAEGTIYRYFNSKKEIFESVLRYSLERLEEGAFKNVNKENSYVKNLENMEKNFLELKKSGEKYYKIKHKAYSEIEEREIKNIIRNNAEKELETVKNVFIWAIDKKEISIKKEMIDTVSFILVGFSQYAMRLYTMEYSESEIEKEIRNVIEYYKLNFKL